MKKTPVYIINCTNSMTKTLKAANKKLKTKTYVRMTADVL